MLSLSKNATLAGLLLAAATAAGAERPVTGKSVPRFEPLDAVVHETMDRIGCQACTLAVAVDGQPVYARGYGWSDAGRTRATRPDAMMRIASCTKPFTAAAVRRLVREGKLAFDGKVLDLLKIDDGTPPADPRWGAITVAHLLEHRGGFDRQLAFDPMFRTAQIEKELRLGGPARPADVVRYMLTRPLDFDPGQRSAYSNFGYCLLGRVIEQAAGQSYFDCVRTSICAPAGIRDVTLGRDSPSKRDPREVWYPVPEGMFSVEVMDSHGGLVASAPALCQFLRAYWISGEPRRAGQRGAYCFFGSLPGTTAMVLQRADGIDCAVLLNGRRNRSFQDDDAMMRRQIDQALDKVLAHRR